MASAATLPTPMQPLAERHAGEAIGRAPLFPVALALTAGVAFDHFTAIPIAFALVLAGLAVLLGAAALASRSLGLPLAYLLVACAALGAAWHHYRCRLVADDDVSLRVQPGTTLVRVRGRLDDDLVHSSTEDNAWGGPVTAETWYSTVSVEAIETESGWEPASGRMLVSVARGRPDVAAGDLVELRGRVEPLVSPSNLGERDREREALDQGVTARLAVPAPESAVRLEPGTWRGGLAAVRRAGGDALGGQLEEPEAGLARALLLGDGRALDQAGWKKYMRTGVVHVLVISGQHLVLLAWAVQFLFDLLRMNHRTAAVGIAVMLWLYALVVGLEPPVLRAVVMMTVICAGRLLGRQALTANTYAWCWVAVLVVQPHDIFRMGCQLSFLAVAVLYWGVPRWLPRLEPTDPLDVLVEQTRPAWQRHAVWLYRQVFYAYFINVMVTLALWPLLLAHAGQVPWTGLLIGPLVVLLTSVALAAGFLTLLLALICPPLACVPAWVAGLCLRGCDGLVDFALMVPGARVTLAPFPAWWAALFYAAFLAALWLRVDAAWGRRILLVGAMWLGVGILLVTVRWPRDECRVTFLDVGKGCCTVIETPDGRVIVYDAGSMFHPAVGRQVIVPYLRARGITRIDELILSHADLDHFNAVRDLLEEMPVGQVTCGPTFFDKHMPQIGLFETLLAEKGVPLRVVTVGDRLTAGEVTMEVLHPPAQGPSGPENVRSLVLLLRHGKNTVLLTGDLEGEGIDRVLARYGERVDVLMAPHHGSPKNNPESLATRYRPALVVSSQGPREDVQQEPYTRHGARYLTTDEEGAVTVRSHGSGLVVETFKTKQRFVLGRR